MADEVVVGTSYTPGPNDQYIRAYNLWIRDVNAAGGLLGRPVRLLWYDDKRDKAQCVENYRRLIQDDKVDLLLGPCHSVMVEPVAPLAEEAQMPLLEGSGSVGEMFRQGRRWLFCCWGIDRDYMKSFLDFMTSPDNPHRITKVAVVCGARPRGLAMPTGFNITRTGLASTSYSKSGSAIRRSTTPRSWPKPMPPGPTCCSGTSKRAGTTGRTR